MLEELQNCNIADSFASVIIGSAIEFKHAAWYISYGLKQNINGHYLLRKYIAMPIPCVDLFSKRNK